MINTKITAKEYLLVIFYSIEDIRRKNEYLCKIIAKQAPKDVNTTNLGKVGSSSHHTTSAEFIYKKIIEVQKEIVELKQRVSEALELIEKLQKPQHKLVLKYRYIYGKSWSKISELMRLNDKYIFFLHREALKEFEKIL